MGRFYTFPNPMCKKYLPYSPGYFKNIQELCTYLSYLAFKFLVFMFFFLKVNMLCLYLYVPVHISERVEFEYFESDSLPAQLTSLFKLSLFLPSQEFDSYRKWRKVCYLYYYVKKRLCCVFLGVITFGFA